MQLKVFWSIEKQISNFGICNSCGFTNNLVYYCDMYSSAQHSHEDDPCDYFKWNIEELENAITKRQIEIDN